MRTWKDHCFSIASVKAEEETTNEVVMKINKQEKKQNSFLREQREERWLMAREESRGQTEKQGNEIN